MNNPRMDALLCVLIIRTILEIVPLFQMAENKAATAFLAKRSAAFRRKTTEVIVNGPIVF